MVINRKKILILEDESPIAEMIADFCATLGHQTRTLNSGENVLETVLDFMPDIILLDLVMPDVSGIEVMEILKTHEVAKKIPVIVISTIANSVPPEGVLKECKAILAKPINIKTLKTNIDLAIAGPSK